MRRRRRTRRNPSLSEMSLERFNRGEILPGIALGVLSQAEVQRDDIFDPGPLTPGYARTQALLSHLRSKRRGKSSGPAFRLGSEFFRAVLKQAKGFEQAGMIRWPTQDPEDYYQLPPMSNVLARVKLVIGIYQKKLDADKWARNGFTKGLRAVIAGAVRAADPDACPRCAGVGTIQAYRHVEGGLCYECGGSGRR